MKRIINRKKHSFAKKAKFPAMLPNPKMAATNAKNIKSTVQRNILYMINYIDLTFKSYSKDKG